MLSALSILMRLTMLFMNGARRAARDVELAVDAVADDDLLLLRLDVDVARALLHRLQEERVDPANDRRLVVGVEDVARGLLVDVGVVALELAAARFALVDAVDRVARSARRRTTAPRRACRRGRARSSSACVSNGSAQTTCTAALVLARRRGCLCALAKAMGTRVARATSTISAGSIVSTKASCASSARACAHRHLVGDVRVHERDRARSTPCSRSAPRTDPRACRRGRRRDARGSRRGIAARASVYLSISIGAASPAAPALSGGGLHVERRRRGLAGRGASAAPRSAEPADGRGQLERLPRLVRLHSLRARELVEAPAAPRSSRIRLADVLEEAVGARVVVRRLVLRVSSNTK